MGVAEKDGAAGLTYADIGNRFGVSRTHVRSLLEDAAQQGDVTLSGRGGRLVELNPPLLESFDRFVADAMSGHDMIYKLTLERTLTSVRIKRIEVHARADNSGCG